MSVTGKLKALLTLIQTPSHSFQDSLDFPQNEDLRSTGFDVATLSDPRRRAALMSQYGMTPAEISALYVNLHDALDPLYDSWSAEDQSLAGVLTNKLTKQRNQDFR